MTLHIEGLRFGRLLAIKSVGSVNKKIQWLFKCDCGADPVLSATLVVRGHTSSCGCLRIDAARESVLKDISGQRFGRMLVLGRNGTSSNGRVDWKCLCECGNEVVRSSKNLVNGTAASCGCRKEEARAENVAARIVDLTGQRFGKLTVLGDAEPSKLGAKRVRCACDCGGVRICRNGDIQSGKVVSCGCAARDPIIYMTVKARFIGAIGSAKRRARLAGASGSFTAAQIDDLHSKQRGKCACCGAKLLDTFHRDHKDPLALGGSNDIKNIELLCVVCNLAKSAKDQIVWANENGRLC